LSDLDGGIATENTTELMRFVSRDQKAWPMITNMRLSSQASVRRLKGGVEGAQAIEDDA
jgi:hypothetical protein